MGKRHLSTKDAALTTSINVKVTEDERVSKNEMSLLTTPFSDDEMTLLTPPLMIMRCLCISLHSTIQVWVHQYEQVSVSDGSTAVLGCLVDGGDIQDFNVNWFKQLPSAAPIFILYHGNDSTIHWPGESLGRYQPIRNSSHAHLLLITNVTVQDSALYWCLLTSNGSFPVWGDGTQLSVYGGKDVQAPTVSLMSSQASLDDPGLLYAACLATGFYPSVIEIAWKFEGETFQGNIISEPFLDEEDNVYTIISILEVTSQSRRNLSSVSCEVRHDSSRTLIKKDLHHCYRDT
ncbi:immunoglobulin lambda-1 light chain-like [Rhinoderma darwinii]|uniref:immunoglobulin lambda-1 light chain-like n=1 Tax=Rhinoderma darwinii TaxID=43563 RepID=UPI003F67232F